MSIRKEFVLRALAKELPIAELARQYGISRKTAYKWLERFRKRGTVGLADESCRPHSSPQKIAPSMEAEIVKLRQEHPKWGSRKLRHVMLRTHGIETPSESSIDRVLHLAGLHRKPRFRPRSVTQPARRPSVVVAAPNDLWTVDFKGWWRTRDGTRCEPLTVRDAHSRFVLALRSLHSTRYEYVKPAFEVLFKRYGLPKAILSDNGPPFACSMAIGGLSRLSAWWVAMGIHVVRSRPGCPQDNGGHERMHVDVCELQARPALNLLAQQAAFDEWVAEFNTVRPHEALKMLTPADVYRPSERRLAGLVIPGYPRNWLIHRVGRFGGFEYIGRKIYLSTVFAGHVVALEERTDHVRVWFHDLLLGRFVHGDDSSVQPMPEDVVPTVTALDSEGVTAATPATRETPPVTPSVSPTQLLPEPEESGIRMDGGVSLW